MTFGTAADDLAGAQEWNAWISLGTAIACLLFVAAYAVLARWWRTYEGRVMMGKAVAIGLLALYTFVAVKIAPESEATRWARVVLVGVIGVFMLFQTARLISNQLGRTYNNRRN
ncbi:membrane protein [Streptomyces phage Keanu]|nr:membrane protein [Streptomyces phage Keanu]